ncbi:MAG: permease-like cell division protein FtsX [Actinomycetota bacterium]|nr:permease-like cell division protein FtsX [Actinomycetota bacterium]
MQSDDVKRMLEAAAAEPSRPLDASALIRRGTRLRRARFAAAAAGLAVVVAGASTSFGILGSDERPGPAGELAAGCEDIGTSAAIYLRNDASETKIAELERALDDSPDVVRLRYVSKEEAVEELRALFEGDAFNAPPPGAVPSSFRVEARDEDALRRIAGMTSPAIDEISFGPLGLPIRCLVQGYCDDPVSRKMSIYLRDDATPAEIATLRRTLDESGAVEELRFVSKRAAYREFKRIYADQPELWETVAAGALPASFRLEAVDDDALQRIEEIAAGRAGVDEVRSVRGMRERFCPPSEETPTEAPAYDLLPVETSAPAPDEPERDGDYPVFTDESAEVQVELRSLACETSPLGNEDVTLMPTGRWCTVSVTILNRGKRALHLFAPEQILTSSTANVYAPWDRATRRIEAFGGLFASGIEPGGSRRGLLIYHLPKGDAPATLLLSAEPGGVTVPVPLGRRHCNSALRPEKDFSCDYAPR